MKKLFYLTFVLLVVLLLIPSSSTWGGARVDSKDKKQLAKPTGITTRGDNVVFDVNNISTFIRNNGSFNRDPGTGGSGFEWPKGSGNTAIYASGLWLGGLVNDSPRVAVAEYAYEYDAGPIASGVNPEDSRWKVYKIRRGDNATSNPDYANWPIEDGAPFVYDQGGNRIPQIIGDMTIWAVFNDNNMAYHTNMNTFPLGVEVQLTAFAFNRSDALGNTVFYRWKLINKGGRDIRNAYVTVWADPDLGDSGDDYDGCDSTLGIGFTYNAGPHDNVYGDAPPATGFDFLQGPLVSGNVTDTARFPDGHFVPGYKFLKMTSYLKYNNDPTDMGNPNNGQEVYNYQRGYWRAGSAVADDWGNPAKFMFSGDPNNGPNSVSNWIESGAGGDRRFLMSSGPFNMAPGDTQEIVAANLIAQGGDYHSSITALKNADKAVQLAYDLNFNLPPPPGGPEVLSVGLDNQVVLTWGVNEKSAEELESYTATDHIAAAGAASDSIYDFEGYVVYQAPNNSVRSVDELTMIKTYDIKDNVKIIEDQVYDAVGNVITKPVKFGSDNGIQRSIKITQDKYTGDRLINDKDYYFVVTAYGYNRESIPKVLESPPVVITVRPQKTPTGFAYYGAFGDTIGTKDTAIGYTVASHDSGVSKGYVIPVVINPSVVTGDRYDVRFTTDTTGNLFWYARNITKNDTVIKHNTNQSGNELYPIVDGLFIKVVDANVGLDKTYGDAGTLLTPTNPDSQWVEGDDGDWGMPYFGGGLDLGANITSYLGFTANDYPFFRYPHKVEVRFTPADSSSAYRYRRTSVGGVTRYRLQDMSRIPVSAWDVTNPGAPIQLNLAWRDQVNDGRWDPSTSYLEVLVVCPAPYDPSGAAYGDGGPWETNAIFILGLAVKSGHTFMEYPNTLHIQPNWSNAPSDVFSFSTAGVRATANSTADAKSQLNRIMAVPNPYFGANTYEKNQFGKVVRFTNLPHTASIKIFNLAADLVRVLDKSDNLTTSDWDLRNKNDLPVASGMYIVYIDMPGFGTKILKVAVIMSEERLDNF